jgi:hypothetical protein
MPRDHSLGRTYHLDLGKELHEAIYVEYLPMRRHRLKDEILRFAEINGLKANLPEMPTRLRGHELRSH